MESPPKRPEPRVKGIGLSMRVNFVVQRYGEEGLKTLLSALQPEQRRAFEFPTAFEWYPIGLMNQIDLMIIQKLGQGDFSVASDIGTYVIEHSFGRIYRVWFRLFEPFYLAERMGRVWHRMSDRGRMECERAGDRGLVVRLYDFAPGHRVCCEHIRGGFVGASRLCGAKNIQAVEKSCVLSGSDYCSWAVSWH